MTAIGREGDGRQPDADQACHRAGAAGFALGLLAWWNTLTPASRLVVAADPQASPNAGWLKGTADEKFLAVERHLRGLDVAMAEIGYRYGELLRAGKTRNWEYAQY
jgi:hypothetical protein